MGKASASPKRSELRLRRSRCERSHVSTASAKAGKPPFGVSASMKALGRSVSPKCLPTSTVSSRPRRETAAHLPTMASASVSPCHALPEARQGIAEAKRAGLRSKAKPLPFSEADARRRQGVCPSIHPGRRNSNGSGPLKGAFDDSPPQPRL
jgi:hypothetical protein